MAAIVECYPITHPAGILSASEGPRHRCTYAVKTDEPLVGDHVLWLAQGNTSGGPAFPSDQVKVPKLGDRLFFGGNVNGDPGSIVEDTGQVISTWIAEPANVNGYVDAGSLALDFETKPQGTGHTCNYTIKVTWRPPEPGEYSRKLQLQNIGRNAGVSSQKVLVENFPATLPTVPGTEAYKARQGREYWVDFRNTLTEWDEAYLVDDFGEPGNTLERMVNVVNQDLPRIQVESISGILTFETLVPTPGAAIALNQAFENTFNSDGFTVSGFAVPARTCLFESAITGRPIVYQNSQYFKMAVRARLVKSLPFHNFYSTSTIQHDGVNLEAALDAIGVPVSDQPLDDDGLFIGPDGDISQQNKKTYTELQPAAYAGLFQELV